MQHHIFLTKDQTTILERHDYLVVKHDNVITQLFNLLEVHQVNFPLLNVFVNRKVHATRFLHHEYVFSDPRNLLQLMYYFFRRGQQRFMSFLVVLVIIKIVCIRV